MHYLTELAEKLAAVSCQDSALAECDEQSRSVLAKELRAILEREVAGGCLKYNCLIVKWKPLGGASAGTVAKREAFHLMA